MKIVILKKLTNVSTSVYQNEALSPFIYFFLALLCVIQHFEI